MSSYVTPLKSQSLQTNRGNGFLSSSSRPLLSSPSFRSTLPESDSLRNYISKYRLTKPVQNESKSNDANSIKASATVRTHSLIDGGVLMQTFGGNLFVPESLHHSFLIHVAQAIQHKEPFFINELATPIFPLFCDFDFTFAPDKCPSKAQIHSLLKLLALTTDQVFSLSPPVAPYISDDDDEESGDDHDEGEDRRYNVNERKTPKPVVKTEPGPIPPKPVCLMIDAAVDDCLIQNQHGVYIKTGRHIYWPSVMVTSELAMCWRDAVLHNLEKATNDRRSRYMRPLPEPLKEWHEVLDANVYRERATACRMIGASKATYCPNRPKGTRSVCANTCVVCKGQPRLNVGRPYNVVQVYDVLSGEVEANYTRRALSDPLWCLQQTSLRRYDVGENDLVRYTPLPSMSTIHFSSSSSPASLSIKSELSCHDDKTLLERKNSLLLKTKNSLFAGKLLGSQKSALSNGNHDANSKSGQNVKIDNTREGAREIVTFIQRIIQREYYTECSLDGNINRVLSTEIPTNNISSDQDTKHRPFAPDTFGMNRMEKSKKTPPLVLCFRTRCHECPYRVNGFHHAKNVIFFTLTFQPDDVLGQYSSGLYLHCFDNDCRARYRMFSSKSDTFLFCEKDMPNGVRWAYFLSKDERLVLNVEIHKLFPEFTPGSEHDKILATVMATMASTRKMYGDNDDGNVSSPLSSTPPPPIRAPMTLAERMNKMKRKYLFSGHDDDEDNNNNNNSDDSDGDVNDSDVKRSRRRRHCDVT